MDASQERFIEKKYESSRLKICKKDPTNIRLGDRAPRLSKKGGNASPKMHPMHKKFFVLTFNPKRSD